MKVSSSPPRHGVLDGPLHESPVPNDPQLENIDIDYKSDYENFIKNTSKQDQ